jgi:alpha-glucosidase (family GH31 glycosyl hydrolase)
LPQEKWYNFHTGQQYLPGTYEIKNVSLTDKIPLFLRDASGILVQDTQYVRQTADLGNIFQLVAGLKFDSSKSTDAVKYYRAQASILSIRDYNEEAKVSQCISQGC